MSIVCRSGLIVDVNLFIPFQLMFTSSHYITYSILIASIPIALPLVLQVNLALGASYLAKHYHAIVTSIPALQDIASMSMLCSDKV